MGGWVVDGGFFLRGQAFFHVFLHPTEEVGPGRWVEYRWVGGWGGGGRVRAYRMAACRADTCFWSFKSP